MQALVGTWKLVSMEREVGGGRRVKHFGDHPRGFLTYCADGRMHAILAAQDRSAPNAAPSDEERARLHASMVAYAGRYEVSGNRIVHRVEISWNESWTGVDLVRIFELEGDLLTLRTAPADERDASTILVWKKM